MVNEPGVNDVPNNSATAGGGARTSRRRRCGRYAHAGKGELLGGHERSYPAQGRLCEAVDLDGRTVARSGRPAIVARRLRQRRGIRCGFHDTSKHARALARPPPRLPPPSCPSGASPASRLRTFEDPILSIQVPQLCSLPPQMSLPTIHPVDASDERSSRVRTSADDGRPFHGCTHDVPAAVVPAHEDIHLKALGRHVAIELPAGASLAKVDAVGMPLQDLPDDLGDRRSGRVVSRLPTPRPTADWGQTTRRRYERGIG